MSTAYASTAADEIWEVYAGEAMGWEIQLLDEAGAKVPITGVLVGTIVGARGTEFRSQRGQISGGTLDPYAGGAFAGDVSAALLGKSGLRFQIADVFTVGGVASREVLVDEPLQILPAPATIDPGAGDLPTTGAVRRSIVTRGKGRVRRTVQLRGRQGYSAGEMVAMARPSEIDGVTPEAYAAWARKPAIDGGDAALAAAGVASAAATAADTARVGLDAVRADAEGVVAAGAQTAGYRDQAAAAAQAAATSAALLTSFSAAYTLTGSTVWAAKLAVFRDGEVLLGVDGADGQVVATEIKGALATYAGFALPDGAMLTTTPSANYIAKYGVYSTGETALGLMPGGVLDVDGHLLDVPAVVEALEGGGFGGGGLGVDPAYTQPTWTATTLTKAMLFWGIGQSLNVGEKAVKPDALFTFFNGAVAPGRAFMMRATTPRLLLDGSAGKLTAYVDPADLTTLHDLRESVHSGDGLTTCSPFVRYALADGAFPDHAIVAGNTAVGGQPMASMLGEANQSTMAVNRRVGIHAATQHVRSKGIRRWSIAILDGDHDNADRNKTSAEFYSLRERLYADWRADIEAAGGADRYLMLISSGAGIYGPIAAPDMYDAALRLAKARADVLCWGGNYVVENAAGALAFPGYPDDFVHPAAIGQARKALLEWIYVREWLAGRKRLPVHLASATVTPSGLVTLTYNNWRPGALAIKTDHVTDPGGNLPYGFAAATNLGKTLSPTIRPRASSFEVNGNVVTYQLELIATGEATGPGADPWVNYASYYFGPLGGGPTFGARGCLCADGSADTRVIAGVTIVPDHYAIPDRMALTLVPDPTPAPSFSAAPTITSDGTPQVGETLTGNDGTITNGSVSARQWLLNGTAISGATGASYVPAETGDHTYRVTATGAGGSASATSAAVTVAAATPPSTPWPYSYALTQDVTGWGSSTMGGSGDGGNGPLYYLATEDTTGATYIKGTPPASGGVYVANRGSGGTTSAQILTAVQGGSAREKAANTIIQAGGNWSAGTLNPEIGVVADAQGMATAIGHNRILHAPKHNDANAPSGSQDWARLRRLNRALAALYPGRVQDVSIMWRHYPPADATDATAQALDKIPPSKQADAAHANAAGNRIIEQRSYSPWVESKESGGLPFVPHQRVFSASYATAQTNGGIVCTLAHDPAGTLAGCTVDFETPQPDFSVAIEGGAITIRRASAAILKADSYRLPVRVTRGGKARTSWAHVHLTNTAPSGLATIVDRDYIVQEGPIAGLANASKTLTLVLGIRMLGTGDGGPASDGTTRNIITLSNGQFLLQCKTTNVFGLIAKAPSATTTQGATVVNMDSNGTAAQRFTEANGLMWLFASVNTATGYGRIAVDANAASVYTPTTDATFDFTWAADPNASRNLLFASNSSTSLVHAEIHRLWLSSGFLDLGPTTGNRDLFRDPATKAATDLSASGGTVGGVTAGLWFEGPAGNFSGGVNLAPGAARWDMSDQLRLTRTL